MQFIVAVDGSDQSEKALDYAIDIAAAPGAAVTVVHAVDPEVYSEGGSEPVADLPDAEQRIVIESIEDAEERGEELLAEAAAHAAERGVDVGTVLLYGDPVEAICEHATEAGADGIVVGHRGLSERYERVLGSVAKDLVEVAPVPVTVVR